MRLRLAAGRSDVAGCEDGCVTRASMLLRQAAALRGCGRRVLEVEVSEIKSARTKRFGAEGGGSVDI